MKILDFLKPELVLSQLPAGSKKRVLESVAEHIADQHLGLDSALLFYKLLERERLGSTALGEGVAIPHCRLPSPSGLKDSQTIIGSLVTTQRPVNFDALDQKKVDLMFFIVVIGEAHQDHLDAIAAVSRLFLEMELCGQLRQADNHLAMYNLVSDWQEQN